MEAKKRIYLDNAATTPLDPLVLEEMLPFFTNYFGNPSSIYSYGRETKLAIENARKKVAKIIGAKPAEVFFTSCGTESINTALNSAVHDLGCKHIISSDIEHHATLHTTQHMAKAGLVQLHNVNILENGHLDIAHLEELLTSIPEKKIVSLMHSNNEIGNLLDAETVSALCQANNALFLCDTVQTLGHIPIDVSKTHYDFITCSAHKFHGPKGVGFLYVNENIRIQPLMQGGAQERNMRAGTENTYGIVGLAKALELATAHIEADKTYVQGLKNYMAEELKKIIPNIVFNGDVFGNSLYTVLNVGIPYSEKNDMILFNLDIHGICVSGGSACSSGAMQGSHVIAKLGKENQDSSPIRFSFSRFTTKEEIDHTISVLKELLA